MATLTTDQRLPVPDRAGAKNAKARATRAVKAGRMTRLEQQRVGAKADLMLYGGRRGRDHVYLVDDSGQGTPRGRMKPDDPPEYRIKPNSGKKERDAITARARRR